jgi:OPA family glycerol-3-phosphate transporter-like MFS transporter
MSVVWALNGISQSMLWAPIIHTLSMNFEGDRLLRVSFGMSFTLVFGYLVSWTSSSILQAVFDWRMIFLIPSIIVAIFCLIWFLFFKENPKEFIVYPKEDEILSDKGEKIKQKPIYKNKGVMYLIIFVVLGAIMHGVIKESINIWLPTMLENVKGFSMESTLGVLFIVPVINFSGIFLSKFISSKTKANSYATIVVITVISLVFSVILLFTQQFSAYILIVFTIILFGLMFAMNPIFTSFLPLTFSKWKVVSTMAGVIDFAIYLGAAFASLLTGYLFEKSGWFAVTVMWFAALVLCLIFTILSNKIYKNNKK